MAKQAADVHPMFEGMEMDGYEYSDETIAMFERWIAEPHNPWTSPIIAKRLARWNDKE